MTLDALNRLQAGRAKVEFLRCCGSTRWAAAITKARPFATLEAMQAKSDEIWASLGKTDWLEAFSAHPKIGEGSSVVSGFSRTEDDWSAAEQSGMTSADEDTKSRLAALNELYERRFGYIFIVCATGKSPAEMLALVEARMSNGPHAELATAAEEQRKITRLRLAKLIE